MYNQVYGKFSMGGGKILTNPDKVFFPIDDPEIIQDHVRSLVYDLDRLGISIKDKIVLDVGTGRQAIAANLLGAIEVNHYDISAENVGNLKKYLETHHVAITTEQIDLVKNQPRPADFIYLHGVVQHFSHTGQGLKNCLAAVNPGGYIWLYFYRSGTFKQFVIFLINDLIRGKKDMAQYFLNSLLLYSDAAQPNYEVSGLMDNLFVDYIHLYEPKTYLEFLRQAGFEVIFSSKLEPQDAVNHTLHESVIIGAKRIGEGNPDIELLAPSNSVNQFSLPYTDVIILETIRVYKELKNSLPDHVVMVLALTLFRFLDKVDIQDVKANHKHLQAIFKNLLLFI